MSRRRAFRSLVAAVLAGSLAGCANEAMRPASSGQGGQGGAGTGGTPMPPDAGPDRPTEVVELKVAWWGSADREKRTRLVFRLFEAKHPAIKIVEESFAATSGATGYWTVMEKRAGDNTLPDIMQHDYAVLEEWTDRGRLRSLDEFVDGGVLKLDDVPESLREGGRVNGHVLGVVLGLNTQGIVLDADQFARAGLTIPSDDWTWDDFEALALQAKAKLGTWGVGGNLWNLTPWRAIFLTRGQQLFSVDGKSLGYTDDKPWNDHLNMMLRLQKAGALPTRGQEPTPNIGDLAIVTGRAAMDVLVNSNQLVALWEQVGAARNLKAVPFPRAKGGGPAIYLKPSQYFSVTAACKHPREAAELIDFFFNDLEANAILLAERGVPLPSKVRAAVKPVLGKQDAEAFALVERVTGKAAGLPLPDPPGLNTIFSQIYVPKVINPVLGEIWPAEMATRIFREQTNAFLMGQPIPDAGPPPRPIDAGADAGPPDATVF
jgi:multiple sugar transport system substrate-binding protein